MSVDGDDFVVGEVGVFGEVGGEGFLFKEVEIVRGDVEADAEFDTVVDLEAGLFAGGLDDADELAGEAFVFEVLSEGFVECGCFSVFDGFDVEFVFDDLFVEAGELLTGVDEAGERLADFDLGFKVGFLHAEHEAFGNNLAGASHEVEDGLVDGGVLWVVEKVDGGTRAGHVLIEFFGKEGSEGGEHDGELDEDGVESPVGGGFVGVVFGLPEAAARAANEPVGEVVDEREDAGESFREIVFVHAGDDFSLELVEAGDNPTVEGVLELGEASLVELGFPMALGVEAVNGGVSGKEIIDVPNHAEFSGDIGDIFVEEGEVFASGDGAGEEEEAERVGGEFVHEFVRVGVVAERFGHFAAVVAGEGAGDDDVFVGVFAKEGGVDDMDVIEPGTDLADVFDDEVGRVVLFEFGLVFEGVVELGEGHGAGLKPAVEDFIDAFEMFVVDVEFDGVDPWAVIIFEFDARELFEFLVRANDFDAAFVALPDGHGSGPEAVTREIPIGRGFDVFLKPTLFDVFGEPVDRLVVGDEVGLEVLDVEEPGREGAVDDA